MAKAQLTARAAKMHTLIENYLASGLTQKAFYEQENIPRTTFLYWLKNYREYNRPARAITKQPERFIELKVKQNHIAARMGCRLEYGNGVSLSFDTVPAAELLLKLIRGV